MSCSTTHNVPDFDDVSLTENTRAAYPIHVLPAIAKGSVGGTPKTVVFLTADAFGVLPPIARLTPEQAVYHFLSGYTAKVAGTERGVTEPQATFSACFGAPFMPLHPTVYGDMLAEKLRASRRLDLAAQYRLDRRRLWRGQAHRHRLDPPPADGGARWRTRRCRHADRRPVRLRGAAGRPRRRPRLLTPRGTWADADAYDRQAMHLAGLFRANFEKFGDAANARPAHAWRRRPNSSATEAPPSTLPLRGEVAVALLAQPTAPSKQARSLAVHATMHPLAARAGWPGRWRRSGIARHHDTVA